MALTSVLPFQAGYFACSASHPAGAALAVTGAHTPATKIAPRTALTGGGESEAPHKLSDEKPLPLSVFSFDSVMAAPCSNFEGKA